MITKTLLNYFHQKLFPEERLIEMLCSFNITNNPTQEKINTYLITHKINWGKFENLVIHNQLIPSILDCFNDRNLKSSFPLEIRQKLEYHYLSIQYIAQFQHKQFSTILTKLAEYKLDFLVMKAYLFDKQLFKGKYYRARCDLDLLVPVNQFEGISTYLFDIGFKHFHDHYTKEGKSNISSGNFYLPLSQEIFKKKDLLVEIHSSVVDIFDFLHPVLDKETVRYITNKLYLNAKTRIINGKKIKVFSNPDLLLSLFLHNFFQHNLQLGIRFQESALITMKLINNSDWDYIIKFVTSIKMKAYFIWYLYLLNDIYPDIFRSKIKIEINKLEKKLQFQQKILLFFMRYKIFHPTNFPQDAMKEKEKEWCWAIMSNTLLQLLFHKTCYRFKRIFN